MHAGRGRSFDKTAVRAYAEIIHRVAAPLAGKGKLIVAGFGEDPDRANPQTEKLGCPVLGIFGNDDHNPTRDQVNRTEERLKSLARNYEFHRYDGCGHAFFNTMRVSHRPEQAIDGWEKVFAFYHKHLG